MRRSGRYLVKYDGQAPVVICSFLWLALEAFQAKPMKTQPRHQQAFHRSNSLKIVLAASHTGETLGSTRRIPANEQTVVGGSRRRWQLFDGVAAERCKVQAVPVADDFPGRIHRAQPGVDSLFAGLPLRFSHDACNMRSFIQFGWSSEAKSDFSP